ncbi:MAG: hypothetical protein AMS19_07110 [Gemmatimonas sp. SG8_23]|jgi:hypothetical protein|nr:MAG: hypothetical protein AMS19_07110 [Gemmatimonas sp. SG8_23]
MKTRVGVLLVAALTAAACGLGIVAGADFSPGADVARYSSFEWDEPDDRPVGDPRLEENPFFEQRLHAAVAVELAEYGIREGADGPRLIVHHHVTVRDRVDVYEADVREGYSATGRESPQVVEFSEGTILVDIADAETKTVLWRGWAQFDITRALANPEVMERAIQEAIGKMFEHFPPQ